MKEKHILAIGVGVFGLAYAFLKSQVDEPIFVLGSLLYVVLVAAIAKRYGH